MPIVPIQTYIRDAETLIALEPEDLAAVCLEALNATREPRVSINFLVEGLWGAQSTEGFPYAKKAEVLSALAEAWQWLQREGLLVQAVDQPIASGWHVVTRRGRKFKTAADLSAFRIGDLLPRGLLADVLEEKVRPLFLRGDYATAVFQAFKEVEVQVRIASGLPSELVGVPLMRKAFDAKDGPLRSTEEVLAEREALAHLFAGAIGYAKNPTSHRDVTIDRRSAARLIMFASELLEIVAWHRALM